MRIARCLISVNGVIVGELRRSISYQRCSVEHAPNAVAKQKVVVGVASVQALSSVRLQRCNTVDVRFRRSNDANIGKLHRIW